MTLTRKFGIILWKNLLLKRRHWIFTTLEVVIPTLLFIVLALIKTAAMGDGGTFASPAVDFEEAHHQYE